MMVSSKIQIFSGHVICILCKGLIPSTKENPDKLHQHLLEEHNSFFFKDLLVKLHYMDKKLLNAIIEFPVEKTKSVEQSVKSLEKLMDTNKLVEENDSFISVDTSKDLAVNENVYDDIEGSQRFYKEKDVDSEYTELGNSYNKNINDFIKTLPHEISYNSKFDKSLSGNFDESDYIMDRINQMDQSSIDDEDMTSNVEDEESTKKKFKTQRVACDVCQKTLSKGSIKNHMRIVHSGVKNIECEVCGEKFESKMEVVKHKAKKHTTKDRRGKLARVFSNNSSLDESSQEGAILRNTMDDDSLEAAEAAANLLNETIPNNPTDEMVDHFDDKSVSVA